MKKFSGLIKLKILELIGLNKWCLSLFIHYLLIVGMILYSSFIFAGSSATYTFTTDVLNGGGAVGSNSATYDVNDIVAQDVVTGDDTVVSYDYYTAGRYMRFFPAVITTNGGADFSNKFLTVTLAGTCDQFTNLIHINGATTGVTRSDIDSWTYTGTITVGHNEFDVVAYHSADVGANPATITVTLDINADDDLDTMPTYWEEEYFGQASDAWEDPNFPYGKNDDYDTDGESNYQEYLADMDPADANSIFKATDAEVVEGVGMTMRFPTSVRRGYRVYYTNDAFSDSSVWALATTVDGTGAEYLWTDDGTQTGVSPLNASIAQRYYKIVPIFTGGWGTNADNSEPPPEEPPEQPPEQPPEEPPQEQTMTTWYAAEGYTGGTFDEYILIMNPTNQDAVVILTFMKEDGTNIPYEVTVRRLSRYTIRVNDIVPDSSVSTKIQSDGTNIIVERAMYWDSGDLAWSEGHCSSAETTTSTTWYLAEGCTAGIFDEYILIMNPSEEDAVIEVTFMKEDGTNIPYSVNVASKSRYTIKANDIVPGASFSTKIESKSISDIGIPGPGIIVERAMYWDAGGYEWAGGHENSGVKQTAATWYLAEGCTAGVFDEYVLIMNPSDQDANVTLTFMKEDGTNVPYDVLVPKASRYTVHANDIVPDSSFSTKVQSDGPGIIVERAMYWDAGGIEWKGGHDSSGITTPGTLWYLAEGTTTGTFDEFILIMNPTDQDANVTLTFMKENGTNISYDVPVPKTSRYTVHVNDIVPDASVSTKVQSDGPNIIVERAMYWDSGDIEWAGGHCASGIKGN